MKSRRVSYLRIGIVVLMLTGAGCAHPATIVTPQGQAAYTADTLIKDLTALSQTAINLNNTDGALHLSVADTQLVKTFTLTAGATANAYAAGTGTLATVTTGLQTLITNLSASAKANSTLSKALTAIQVGLTSLTGGN
jgi:hypothetical protein